MVQPAALSQSRICAGVKNVEVEIDGLTLPLVEVARLLADVEAYQQQADGQRRCPPAVGSQSVPMGRGYAVCSTTARPLN